MWRRRWQADEQLEAISAAGGAVTLRCVARCDQAFAEPILGHARAHAGSLAPSNPACGAEIARQPQRGHRRTGVPLASQLFDPPCAGTRSALAACPGQDRPSAASKLVRARTSPGCGSSFGTVPPDGTRTSSIARSRLAHSPGPAMAGACSPGRDDLFIASLKRLLAPDDVDPPGVDLTLQPAGCDRAMRRLARSAEESRAPKREPKTLTRHRSWLVSCGEEEYQEGGVLGLKHSSTASRGCRLSRALEVCLAVRPAGAIPARCPTSMSRRDTLGAEAEFLCSVFSPERSWNASCGHGRPSRPVTAKEAERQLLELVRLSSELRRHISRMSKAVLDEMGIDRASAEPEWTGRDRGDCTAGSGRPPPAAGVDRANRKTTQAPSTPWRGFCRRRRCLSV